MKSASSITEEQAREKVRALNQEHLLHYYPMLSERQQESLLRQIALLDPLLYERQKNTPLPELLEEPFPFEDESLKGDPGLGKLGKELVQKGKVAALVLAGGQGSRLRFEKPKGCFPVTCFRHKSLFQLIAEKVKAASKQVAHPLEIAIMTSPLNHVEIQTYFAQHAFFGLSPRQCHFFYQRMWPLLDLEENYFLEAPDQIARGPNGNGGVFRRLVELGIWNKWQKRGVELVNVIPVDNPLSDPFDYELVGFHSQMQNEATIKAARKVNSHEKVGVLARVKGKATILEYSELSEEKKKALNSKGELLFSTANLGFYCFSMPFIEKVSHVDLPLHPAKKAVRKWNPEGHIDFPETPNAWKFEEFIFDVLPLASRVKSLIYPREECFAPLKNLEGEDSIESVQQALLAFDRKVFARVTGHEVPAEARFELSPAFYYPTKQLLEKWKGQSLPDEDYIHE